MDKKVKKDFIYGVGRRKEASAEVRVYTVGQVKWGETTVEKGDILVNKIKAEEYFGKEKVGVLLALFRLTNTEKKFAVTVKVSGGGKEGQLEAAALGIARAFSTLDREKYRTTLKRKGLLTRDPRARERRKVGMGGKARRRKQSPKR